MTSPEDRASPALAAYGQLLDDLKGRIRSARCGAALAVNRALIELYWEIGHEILRMRSDEGWAPRSASGSQPTCGASFRK
jgi:DUF1016 N-terminal domain